MQQSILSHLARPAAALRAVLTARRGALTAAATAAALGIATAGGVTRTASAQSLFSPAIRVNDETISHFELQQRIRMMQVLRVPGDAEELARKALIEERLKREAIREAGITVSPEDIEAGIEELAQRTQLPPDEFVKALEQEGVARETLRDFVEIGVAWRDFVQQRFLAQARPTEDEIDRAIGQGDAGGGIQVLLSEVILPVNEQNFEQAQALALEIAKIDTTEAFAATARQYSASESRANGGDLGWVSLTKLPPGLQSIILELKPGQVSDPINLPNAIALFQMRGMRESAPAEPRYSAIDYAMYFIPGGRSAEALQQAAELRQRVDTCNDLYGVAQGQPPEVLLRESKAPGEIPRDVALELARLDDNEVSTALTRNNGRTLVFLMLCGRTSEIASDASREDVAQALAQQRLALMADSYLQQLLAEARIEEQ
ncbi:peptidylprolyl isomerase [Jhaorihella thermophila]|uniref:Parvulin-like PPIase n=1 Tax=Jhaorihella thermophila TaxID=488547 RepID=A0A1H5SQ55_9RHOB|nr:peptidylprolyl isomerase [Jhaorihella thermophila]SEF51971.1 peptidyl-prolyl cis-trans isomerase SurA [Jhaorihella thermophila]